MLNKAEDTAKHTLLRLPREVHGALKARAGAAGVSMVGLLRKWLGLSAEPVAAVPVERSMAVKEEARCKRCGHLERSHTRGEQKACGLAGCNCARWREGEEVF